MPVLVTATALLVLHIGLHSQWRGQGWHRYPAFLNLPESLSPADATFPVVDVSQPWFEPSEEDFVGEPTPAEIIPVKTTSEKPLPADGYLAFCVAAKDQEKDLSEFLRHHYYHMNVSHFYIMDDHSEPPISTVKDYGIPRSALTFHYYDVEEAAQHPAGKMQWFIDNECMRLYGSKHTWIGFIDVDEFFEVVTNETMEGILREFEQKEEIGALGVNWKTHTSSGLLTRPESVRDSFVVCIDDDDNSRHLDIGPLDKHVKSIVQTAKYASVESPHQFHLKNGTITAGEDGRMIRPGNGQRIPIVRERIALHHYAVKSRQEFEEKMARWKGDIPRGWAFWDEIEGIPSIDCPEMARRFVD
jgi:hypothetical protein